MLTMNINGIYLPLISIMDHEVTTYDFSLERFSVTVIIKNSSEWFNFLENKMLKAQSFDSSMDEIKFDLLLVDSKYTKRGLVLFEGAFVHVYTSGDIDSEFDLIADNRDYTGIYI